MEAEQTLLKLFEAPIAGEWPRINCVEVRQKLKPDSTIFHLILRLGFSEDAPYYDIEDQWRCLEAQGASLTECVAVLTSDLLEVAKAARAKRIWQEEVATHVGSKVLLRGGPGGYGSVRGRIYRREINGVGPGREPHFALPEAAIYSITVAANTEGRVIRIDKGYLLVEVSPDQFWVPAWELRPGITDRTGTSVIGSETVVWLP